MNQSSESHLAGFQLEPAANDELIQDLLSFAATGLPRDYLELIRFSDGASGWLNGRYLIVYSVSQVKRLNLAANTEHCSPGHLIFASNGGGTYYLLEKLPATTSTIFRCEDVDLGPADSTFVASSIADFLGIYGPSVA